MGKGSRETSFRLMRCLRRGEREDGKVCADNGRNETATLICNENTLIKINNVGP